MRRCLWLLLCCAAAQAEPVVVGDGIPQPLTATPGRGPTPVAGGTPTTGTASDAAGPAQTGAAGEVRP